MKSFSQSLKDITANSWKYWHGKETVTLVVSGTPEISYSVDEAKRFEVTTRDIPTQKTGAFVGADLIWIIPSAKLPGILNPKIADRVVDAYGNSYTVLDTFENGWRNWWKLTTRNLVFAYSLKDVISHWTAQNSKDSGGGRIAGTYTKVKENVPAKIQEITSAREDLLGKRQARRIYEIHCGEMIDWSPTDQIRDQHGIIYQTVSAGAVGIIDGASTVLTVERVL